MRCIYVRFDKKPLRVQRYAKILTYASFFGEKELTKERMNELTSTKRRAGGLCRKGKNDISRLRLIQSGLIS